MKHLINWLIPTPVLVAAWFTFQDWRTHSLTTHELATYALVLLGYVLGLALVHLRYRRKLAQIRRHSQKGSAR